MTTTIAKNWVSNKTADEVVSKVQQDLISKTPDARSLQQLMDLVSGVQAYSTLDHRRQGVIRGIFDKESEKFKSGSRYRISNFSLDLDDVISTFWEHVIKYLPRASVTGGVVPVRVVAGQDAKTTATRDGLSFADRDTKCNPVHYLRKMGVMGVRNLVNSVYRKNLIQVCEQCSSASNVSRVEIEGKECPKCKSTDVENHWPDGNSAYRVRKEKLCKGCQNTWTRKFAYSCQTCQSNEIRIESRYGPTDDLTQLTNDDVSAEETLITHEAERELDNILRDIYNFLPADPRDPTLVSRTKEIFTILVDPKASVDICRKCVSAAPQVCADQCKEKDCKHTRMPDPKVSCGATTFSINKCVNFSRKIGEYHGCSASLSARRVKKVRQYFIRFVKTHRNLDLCRSLHGLLDERGLLSQY